MKNIIIKSISKFTKVITGGTPSTGKSEYWDGNIPWLNSGILNDGDIKTPSKYITELGLKNSSARLMPKDTVLIALTGTTTGQVAYLSFEATANQSVTGILPSKEHHPRYLYYYLKSQREKIRGDAFGGAQPHINQKYIKDFKVPLPLLNDQIRIANLLDQVESLITNRKESIALLDELLKSTFLDMFGDPVLNSKEWETFPLKKFGNIITGNTPPRVRKEFYNNQYIEWIKTDNIFPDEMYISNSKEYLSEEGLKKGRYLKSGSLLVTCIAGSIKSIGTAALSNRPVAFNQQMNAIEPNDKVNSFYLYWLFKICKKYFQDKAGKGMKKIITKSTFEKIIFPMPPKPLQDKFAIIVQQVEQTKTILLDSLEGLQNLFTSLSHMAFKGELDLHRLKVDLEETNTLSIVNTISDRQKENYNPIRYLDKNSNPVFDEDFLQMLIQQSDDDITFESINKKLEKFSFPKQPSYEDVQTHIFSLIKKSYLQQLFDKQKNEIVLRKKI